jgi:tyrosyl-tRNA synthetase
MNHRLGQSSERLMKMLQTAPDLRNGDYLDDILALLAERRKMDLSDLNPAQQAALIASRTVELLPSQEKLEAAILGAQADDRELIVKFGIDPTAADVHVGHAVPMILASRFQRMGHHFIFIVGDITAKIGDPSGRTSDRPQLTDDDIRRNLSTYRQQVSPFFDFTSAAFMFNSEWLAKITLPEMIGILEKLPLSASLQRDDFRKRLAAGSSITIAELLYSVVMALDSVEVNCDVEIGGLDQLLNMQMCRRVMENAGLTPEVVVTSPLIEGTDGSGAKMSKSKGNYVGLTFTPNDIYGKFMSATDRLVPDYLRALTELLDPEVELLTAMMRNRQIHPMGVKSLLASDVIATIHGLDAAAAGRREFQTQFSVRKFSELASVPSVPFSKTGAASVAEVLVKLAGLIGSQNQVRRVAAGGGLRLVVETPTGEQRTTTIDETYANLTLGELPGDPLTQLSQGSRTFLKCGRVLLELTADGQ